MDLDEHLETTTRRTVVKTGVKLAYAAPVVAATLKYTANRAVAASTAEGTFTVPANAAAGVCTAYTLDANDEVEVEAGGRIDLNVTNGSGLNNVDTVNADGLRRNGTPAATTCTGFGGPNTNCGALFAKIGSTYVFVGEGPTTITGVSGQLCFVVNDIAYGDNVEAFSGAYEVTFN